jgi:carbamoyltransferase
MRILGVGITDHELAAAAIVDGTLRVAIARERLTRVKRDGKLWGSRRWDPYVAVQYCLDSAGLSLCDVDLVVWNHIDHVPAMAVSQRLAEEGGLPLLSRPHIALSHHFAHACCAYYLSGFEQTAVLVADGAGGPIAGLLAHTAGADRDALAGGGDGVPQSSTGRRSR